MRSTTTCSAHLKDHLGLAIIVQFEQQSEKLEDSAFTCPMSMTAVMILEFQNVQAVDSRRSKIRPESVSMTSFLEYSIMTIAKLEVYLFRKFKQ